MRIITHNVYWFQGCPSRWGTERAAEVEEVFLLLANLYRGLRPDIVCLQEVRRPELAERLARLLGLAVWIHVPGGVRKEYGGTILARAAALRDCTAVGGRSHERHHARASVVWAGLRLEVAAVHLPSNRYASSPEAAERMRVAELERVLHCPPTPDLVCGDLNCQPGSPAYCRLVQDGYADAAVTSAGPSGPRGRRTDYIWCAPRLVGQPAIFRCVRDGPFRQTDDTGRSWSLSDHPPLLLDLGEQVATPG